MTTPSATGNYQRCDRVVSRVIAGERFLVPISGNSADLTQLYLLNETASAAWELLATPRSVAALCDMMGREYDVGAETLCADLEELLRDLLERRLINDGGGNG